jgi:hypothetical protein
MTKIFTANRKWQSSVLQIRFLEGGDRRATADRPRPPPPTRPPPAPPAPTADWNTAAAIDKTLFFETTFCQIKFKYKLRA